MDFLKLVSSTFWAIVEVFLVMAASNQPIVRKMIINSIPTVLMLLQHMPMDEGETSWTDGWIGGVV